MKTLDLVPVKVDEIREYFHTVKGKKISIKRLTTKTIFKPSFEAISIE